MLYRPDYLLKQAKRDSANAWDHYVKCQQNDVDRRDLLWARDNYIAAHNKVTAIAQEIKKRDRTTKKTICPKARI